MLCQRFTSPSRTRLEDQYWALIKLLRRELLLLLTLSSNLWFRSYPRTSGDTKDFLRQRELNSLRSLPPGAIVFTMDVVGLYSHIPNEDGLKACHTLLERRTVKKPSTSEVVHLAWLVLELNSCQYQYEYYLQTQGTVVCTRMAPSYANLFTACLEEKMLSPAHRQLVSSFYRRFIDDILGIWCHGEEAFEEFLRHANAIHPGIVSPLPTALLWTSCDALVKIHSCFIITDLYTKVTDTHQYLLPTSNHTHPHTCIATSHVV